MNEPLEEFRVTKGTGEIYKIRPASGFGWGIFVIDESTGLMSCVSDYGDYAYTWPHHGRKSFKHFLVEIGRDWGYLLEKVAPDQTEFKFKESMRLWKRALLHQRREGYCSKEDAAYVWAFLKDIAEDDCRTVVEALLDNETVCKVLDWDTIVETVTGYNAQAMSFATRLYPLFVETLREELKCSA